MRRLALASSALLLTPLLLLTPATADSHPRAAWMNRTCQTEDQNDCFWDASDGNGDGHSFYAHKIGKVVCIMYVSKSYAKRHDYCY